MCSFPAGAPRRARRIVIALAAALFLPAGVASADDDEPGLGPPPLYDELREAEPAPAGHVRGGRLWIDRFEFELERGDLFLTPPVGDRPHAAVFLGRGTVRAWPPDGVEHQQLRKLIDEDRLEEEFERFVFWFTGDLDERLRALVTEPPATGGRRGRAARRQHDRAVDLLEDRRESLLEDRLRNPDARVALDRWRAAAGLAAPADRPYADRPYFFAELDGREHDWFSIEIEPRDLEEVTIGKFDRRRKLLDVWMSFHALDEFDPARVEPTLGRFPRDPETAGPVHPDAERDDDEWSFRDYGLSPRYLVPDEERWYPRMGVSRTDVDMAIEGNGDVRASVALVMEPLAPLAAFRLTISPFADVTDVRWRTDLPPDVDDATRVALLAPDRAPPERVAERDPDEADDGPPGPDEPAPIAGEQLHYVQATHDRRFSEDLHDPWLTVLLPRPVGPGERFVLEIAYEAELIERLRDASGYLLKDTGLWIPRHPDNRRRRFDLTFRVPERFRIASGGALLDERVEDDTRIMRWVTNRPVRGTMSFHMGRFEVDEVTREGLPPIAVYADRNHVGFAPGNREKTLEDLIGSLRTYIDYFGPYPFDSLLVTETRSSGGQAFPGLVLLTFQVFGALHTGESELFRAHEVAHQWWGAGADWESYRDQWITEGFANYSAALYVLSGLGEEDQFRDMLDAWRLDALGEVNVGQGFGKRYGFVPAVVRESDGNESGALVVGFRLRTTDTPFDYRLIVYEKGAFVLHMLRMLLMDLETGDDRRFRDLMRGFMDAHVGGVANTRAFEAAVAEAFGEPMDWFFDQWVYGVEVPTFRPDLDVSPLRDAREPFVLHGRVRQEDVPPGFRSSVPIRLEFRDRDPIVRRILIDRPEVDVEIPIPAEPTRIEFNYLHGVLARVR